MKQYCCQTMRNNLTLNCNIHHDQFACPDVLVTYIAKFDEYGIIVHDGGTGVISIRFCPWCGTALPPSRRALWFDTPILGKGQRYRSLDIARPCVGLKPFRYDLFARVHNHMAVGGDYA